MMQWTNTPESSNVSGIAYSDKQHMLFIEFKGKCIYSYAQVPRKMYQAFRIAPSKGKFFHREIKKLYKCSGNLRSDRSGLTDNQLELFWNQ